VNQLISLPCNIVALARKLITGSARGSQQNGDSMKPIEPQSNVARNLVLALCVAIACLSPATDRAASPAELISHYRLKNGEGRVTADPVLTRIAQAQANAMAARDLLDHAALGPLSSRATAAASAGAGRIAENLAGAYADFPRTLDQWIGSPGHRSNLLMHDALRVGVASAKSPKSGQTYWAMEIAGDYEPVGKPVGKKKPGVRTRDECSLQLGGTCLN
jgi:uncharacterized protein YkwD